MLYSLDHVAAYYRSKKMYKIAQKYYISGCDESELYAMHCEGHI